MKTTRRTLLASIAAATLGITRVRATPTLTPPPQGSPCVQKWAKSFCEHAEHYPDIATDEGTMAGWFANAMMSQHDHTTKKLEKRLQELNRVRDIQGDDGNWDFSPAMLGYYNGLEFASAIMEGREPEFRDFDRKKVSDAATKFRFQFVSDLI